MATMREVKEGLIYQGVDEEIVYTITTTPVGSGPINEDMTVWDMSVEPRVDVTAGTTSGAMAVVGDVITLKSLESLTAGKLYRVEVEFETGGSKFERYFRVKAEL